MKDFFKKTAYRIFHLPALAVIILVIIAAMCFFPALNYEGEYFFLPYIAYLYFSYVLIVSVVSLTDLVRNVKAFISSFPLGKRFLEDKLFRGRIGLYFGGAVNLIFIFSYFLSGVHYKSLWFISIAFFYLALVIIKQRLAITENRISELPENDKRREEIKAYTRTGIFLILLALLIAGIGAQVVMDNKSYSYNQMLIYGVGAYAFYYLAITIYNMIFFKKRNSYIWSAIQSVNFTTALLGIFTFQTGLLSQVGTNADRGFFNIITLIGLLVIVALKAVYMIIKGCVHGKKL